MDTDHQAEDAWVLGVQRKLYQQSKAHPDEAWRDLWGWLTDPRMIRHSWRRVASNKGKRSAGIDGITVKHIQQRIGEQCFLEGLRAELRSGAYRPSPSRRKLIPKAGKPGQFRPLGIPTVKDRVVQGVVKALLEPIFEAQFWSVSYGFRPGRSTHGALEHIRMSIQPRKLEPDGRWHQLPYSWVIEGDIKGCFDNINHHHLMDRLRLRIVDRQVMELIGQFLKAGVLAEDQLLRTDNGTPQGGIITPLTQKVISSSNGQLRDGEPGTLWLIYVLRRNTFMADDAIDQSGEGSTAERRSWSAPASSCASRSSTAVVTRVRFVRAPSISLPGRSLASRSTSRSSRSHRAGHVEASTADGGTAPEVREKQRPDHGSDRSRRIECVSTHSKKAWLSRVEKAADFKSTFPIRLIACSSRSSRRLTTFWCHVANAPSACA